MWCVCTHEEDVGLLWKHVEYRCVGFRAARVSEWGSRVQRASVFCGLRGCSCLFYGQKKLSACVHVCNLLMVFVLLWACKSRMKIFGLCVAEAVFCDHRSGRHAVGLDALSAVPSHSAQSQGFLTACLTAPPHLSLPHSHTQQERSQRGASQQTAGDQLHCHGGQVSVISVAAAVA